MVPKENPPYLLSLLTVLVHNNLGLLYELDMEILLQYHTHMCAAVGFTRWVVAFAFRI